MNDLTEKQIHDARCILKAMNRGIVTEQEATEALAKLGLTIEEAEKLN